MMKLFCGYVSLTQPFCLMLSSGSGQKKKVRMKFQIALSSFDFWKEKPNQEKGLRGMFHHDETFQPYFLQTQNFKC